jgi:hypothetical protein
MSVHSTAQHSTGIDLLCCFFLSLFVFTFSLRARSILPRATRQMLTNDVIPTSGDAYLSGLNIMTHQQEVRHLLGYCPQFDSLIDNLTAREHLMLYARIKGVPESDVKVRISPHPHTTTTHTAFALH